ncbi:hypothetical protein ACFYKX_04030 [Cytobacillus sp. FJAT-54145]|uniref:Uncharacterized protein n=1 Tax=Cytobacillus spartinae TaxID=3299023 RepID=A0ABW6K7T1_9BACI
MMINLDIVFMIVIVIASFYQIFIKAEQNDWSRFRSESLSTIARYLHFGSLISIFAGIIYDIKWMPWIALYSMVGIILCLKPKEDKTKGGQKFVLILLFLLIFNVLRVPTHQNSFQDYISTKETYQCIHSFECVKLTSIVTAEDLLETKVEILPVEGYSFDFYYIFAKGSLKLANEDEMKGLNIAGFWIEY